MPIYEYRCRGCGHEFEQLVRTGGTPACPACEGHELERLLSQVSISSEQTRERSFSKARRAADAVRRDRDQAHNDYVRKQHEEHH